MDQSESRLPDKVRSGCNGVTKKIMRRVPQMQRSNVFLLGNFAPAAEKKSLQSPALHGQNFNIQISGKQ